ncbi:efflux RND transporter periplasmic adaptor subunit [Pseudohalioglobus lutimaris]|uniref:efflux RND transporter periplasmic adaptor subunit n=1 Tax=Pseudohalioglobus lutimaris TaxID=1737061 RepID=UPI00096B924B|nr:efflux RND transporter periplasmic adaptor subunit [Pseudohalioglobus lutimaris]
MNATRQLFSSVVLATCFTSAALAQQSPVPVLVEQVREQAVERSLPLNGRVHSRHDASLSLTLSGQLEWVLEPGTLVRKGEVIGQLDQQPILLRKAELSHLAQREQVNGAYLDKELVRLKRLMEANNASERLVDESESQRDISRLELRSLQARIAQLDDELRRSRLVAPFSGVIAQRLKRGGEYVNPGEPIARLVDLEQLELRFQVPVSYLGRLQVNQQVAFAAQGGQLLGETPPTQQSTVRTIIPAADSNSQTFEVRADIDSSGSGTVIAGQLVNVSLQISSGKATVQIPRDAIVLRSEGNYVFRIDEKDKAHRVPVEVGEGSTAWVSVRGKLSRGDWVAVRGLERLQDGQTVMRRES